MKRYLTAALLAALLLLTAGCSSEKTDELFAMDTVMTFTAYGKNAKAGIAAAKAEIERLDALLSISGSQSDIARINGTGGGEVSAETAELIGRAVNISSSTDGAFDITVSPVVRAWGFYSDEYAVPDSEVLSAALKLVGTDMISVDGVNIIYYNKDVKIDLGGIAKGYAARKAAEAMEAAGVTSAVMSLGGNVRVVGTKPDGSPWRVGIADPKGPSAYAGVLEAADTAVVTSGGYQRYFDEGGVRYHHIIDPSTGYPAESGIISATVVTEDDVLADGLSTALFVMGAERAAEYWRHSADGFEMILITSEGRALVTEGIADAFKVSGGYETEVLAR